MYREWIRVLFIAGKEEGGKVEKKDVAEEFYARSQNYRLCKAGGSEKEWRSTLICPAAAKTGD